MHEKDQSSIARLVPAFVGTTTLLEMGGCGERRRVGKFSGLIVDQKCGEGAGRRPAAGRLVAGQLAAGNFAIYEVVDLRLEIAGLVAVDA
jgi:hypothetical protein